MSDSFRSTDVVKWTEACVSDKACRATFVRDRIVRVTRTRDGYCYWFDSVAPESTDKD